MSARTFAVGLLHGPIQAPPGVNIPAVPLPVLQAMAQTDRHDMTWPSTFSSSSSSSDFLLMLCFGVMGGSECKYMY